MQVIDAFKASYGVDNPLFAILQLAQTTMRSEIGKMSLDNTFEERDMLNHQIVTVLNSAALSWGLECLRYEIKDITPPQSIIRAMELQAEAERRKRAQVLESEGFRQATINESEATRVRLAVFCIKEKAAQAQFDTGWAQHWSHTSRLG